MHAYEYGIRNFNKKYQPAPNVTVFNDLVLFVDDTDTEAEEQFIPQSYSIFSYKQVKNIEPNTYSYNLKNRKVINGNLMQDYLIPNGHVSTIENAIIQDIPEFGSLDDSNSFQQPSSTTIFKYEDDFYVEAVGASYGGGTLVIEATQTKYKLFAQHERKLRDLFENPNISLIFFFSKNGAKLESANLSIDDVKDNEIIFFLEKDDSYNIFGSVVRVLSGKNITDVSQIPFRDISHLGNLFDVNTRPRSIKKVSKSHIEAKKRNEEKGIFYYLGKAVDFVQELTTTLIKETLGDGLVFIGDTISTELQFAEKRWRYYDEFGEKNTKFTPIIPGFDHLLDYLDEVQDNIQENSENFMTKLDSIEKDLKSSIDKIPIESIKDYVKFQLTVIFDIIKFMRRIYDTVLKIISSKEIFIFINALLIGLLNSLSAAVGGIISLIGYILSLPYYLYKLKNVENKGGYVSMAMEVLETGIESVVKLFSLENIKAVFFFVQQVPKLIYDYIMDPGTIADIDESEKKSSIQIDSIAYGLGYAVGFIVEEVVTTIVTGGAKTVASAIKVTLASFKSILKSTGKLAGDVILSPLKFVEALIFLFKKMKKLNVKKILDDLLKWLQKVLITGKKYAQDLYQKTFSKKAQRNLKAAKYEPTGVKNGLIQLCPIKK